MENDNNLLSEVMWHCGDYVFYIMKKYFPDYDYYWQFDYDVYCNGPSYKTFFDKYLNNDKDLIISNFKAIDNVNWAMLEKSDWIYKDVQKYSSFFPVERLSARAIDFLYKKRLEHKEIFSKIADDLENRWVNCELFTPTELMNNGFKCEALNEYLRFEPNYDLNEDRLFESPDNRLYHPIKGNYESKIEDLKSKLLNALRDFTFSFSIFKYRIKVKVVKKK